MEGADLQKSTSKVSTYFTDVNGDGLVDLVMGSSVYFNHIEKSPDGSLVPTFTLSSEDTPSPIKGGGIIDDSGSAIDPQEQAEMIANNPLQDIVRVWIAPCDGTVKIDGNLQLQVPAGNYDTQAYAKADGVRVAVQKNDTEIWEQVIAKGDGALYNPDKTESVKKGDKIYFRVQSGITQEANGDFDQVAWSPVVTYTSLQTEDPNGYTQSFPARQGDIVTGTGVVMLPPSGSYTVKSKFVKPVTSDSITLKVILGESLTVYERTFADQETFDGQIEIPVANTIGAEQLQFIVSSSSSIAWETINWKPVVHYSIDVNGHTVESTLPATIRYEGIYGQLHNLGTSHTIQNPGKAVIATSLIYKPGVTPIEQLKTGGAYTLTIKQQNALIYKSRFIVANGAILQGDTIKTDLPAGKLWIELFSDAGTMDGLDAVASISTQIQDTLGIATTAATSVYYRWDEVRFGPLHRSWGQYSYNSMQGRANEAIQEDLLDVPTDENDPNANPVNMVYIPMSQDVDTRSYWQGNDPAVFIRDGIMSASRLGQKDIILENPLSGLSGTTARGVEKRSVNKSKSAMAGGSPATGISGTISTAAGDQEVISEFADLNGDGYPDIISRTNVQVTNTSGGFDGEIIGYESYHESKSKSKSVGTGGNPVHASSVHTASASLKSASAGVADARGSWLNSPSPEKAAALQSAIADEAAAKGTLDKALNQAYIAPSFGASDNSEQTTTFMDVNGDGLPDKILSSKQVQLNLGYGFTEPVDWQLDKIQQASTTDGNVSLGFNKDASSWSGGIGVNASNTSSDFTMSDLNGDGLLDKVRVIAGRVYVSFNLGSSFAPQIEWKGMTSLSETSAVGESINAAFTAGFPIFLGLKMVINPGMNTDHTINKTLSELRDVDGDGFPDAVSSDKESRLEVKRSTIARTNKLKAVSNPLGGSFTLDYNRSEATYDHPGGKWVVKSVEVNDGIHDDGANMKTVFEYQDGRQERHEREFLGFGKVIAKSIDTESPETEKVYRKAIQVFDTKNYYTAGNLLQSAVEDESGNKFTETLNEYYTYKISAAAESYNFTEENFTYSDKEIAFTPLKYTKTMVYEGESTGLTANESFYEYYLNGGYGELKSYKYSDKGNLGASGSGEFNYQTRIEYTHNRNKHILGLPVKVQVTGSDGVLYRQTEAGYELAYGHITKVSQLLNEQGDKAEMDILWDRYGNIKQKTLPANSKGQRMWYKYLYDRDYNMYVERVEDAFGYRSEMEDYDYRYGIPMVTRDMNGYTLEQSIDHLGRIVTITGPNEQVLGLPYTIKFEYHPGIEKDDTGIKSPAYAVTKHYDPQHPADDLETVTFVDGFGRAIQVKKDGVVTQTTGGTNPVDKKVMIVSGRAKFDPFGRVKEAFYPVTEGVGSKTVFNRTFDAVTPSITEYDVMDRAVKTILPDGSESLVAYSKDNSSRMFVTTVTDAMGGSQSTFTNGSGLTVKTEQYSGPEGTITTSFVFDPINQLLKAIDNGGNETVSAYDMAGRRTSVIHPASGLTNFAYDKASNLIGKQTANLEAEGKFITYEYDYSRLTEVKYPDHPENNVRYTYGNKNASHNRVGRLMLQEDATGAQEFFYGRLGETSKVRRTVIIPNQAIATYETQWKYDSWNRLEEMIYPDGEKISYAYNTAGLLESVKGEKAYSYNYVNKLGYDKFEQRIYMKYCNGAETSYDYDPLRRRLQNLIVISGKEDRKQIMNNAYTYDRVDNVLSVINTAPLPTTGMGGQMAHTYNYDGLYRLQSAMGTYTGADSKSASYSLEMGYDNLHNITSKKQHVQQQGIQFDGILKAGYELSYSYSSERPHQIQSLKDENYRTEGDTSQDKITKDHAYQYDANGNLIYINTAREKQDGAAEEKANERRLLWDEENRLMAINTNGFISGYWYDAGGERVVKVSGDDEGIYVNDVFSGGRTETANFTAYVNPYMVISKGGQYTKHIYIGSQRIVSKLGDLDSYGQDPRRVEYAGEGVDGAKIDYKAKYKQSQQSIKEYYVHFEVPYYGKDNDDYVNGSGFCCDGAPNTRSFDPAKNDNPELFQYYYHSDHLGSSSLITNLDGESRRVREYHIRIRKHEQIVQHIEYVPFGEVFIEERNNRWNTPYLFNAKELDEETGLYYYGARYYDPRTSVWISTDPMQEKYPNISTYAYTFQNPIKYIDPDGMVARDNVSNKIIFIPDKNMQPVVHAGGVDGVTEIKGNVGYVLANDGETLLAVMKVTHYKSGDKWLEITTKEDLNAYGTNCAGAISLDGEYLPLSQIEYMNFLEAEGYKKIDMEKVQLGDIVSYSYGSHVIKAVSSNGKNLIYKSHWLGDSSGGVVGTYNEIKKYHEELEAYYTLNPSKDDVKIFRPKPGMEDLKADSKEIIEKFSDK